MTNKLCSILSHPFCPQQKKIMPHARFTQGSTLRHIIVMSLSNAIGLTAMFFVDMLDLFFLSLLGEKHLAAAVGYAGTILFLTTSIGIGIAITAGALISKAIGEGNKYKAHQLMVNVAALCFLFTTIIAATIWIYIPELLTLVGAHEEVHFLASQYLNIVVPSMPIMALAMSFSAALRAVGDAKRSMSSTLAGGTVNAVLDPIFIFALNMGIEGAAIASVLARVAILLMSSYGVIKVHKLMGRFNWNEFKNDRATIINMAVPAIMTNLATPVGSVFITRAIANYGDGFVAGYAIIGRIIPVAFSIVFALSGAVGPIIGQNYGARLMGRVRQSLKDAYWFSTVYILALSLIIYLTQDYLIFLFNAKGNAAELIRFFCTFVAISFTFNGMLFIANAAFNNLGKPTWSTAFNWGKATIGTIPFVVVGANLGGVYGILMGQALGGVLFALAALYCSFKLVLHKEQHMAEIQKTMLPANLDPKDMPLPRSLNPLSSECAQMCQMAEEAECEEHLLDEVAGQNSR